MTKTYPDCQATVLSASQPERVDVPEALTKALNDFSDFINEPPQYEDMRMVRDYRHELAGKWIPVFEAIQAALAAAPAVDATQGALALYLNEVQPVDGRVQINISLNELNVLRGLAATPAVGGEALPAWEDAQVQIVYEAICQTDENVPPNPEEHWEGWMSRRIVAALRAAQPASPLRGRAEPTEEMVRAAYKDQPNAINVGFAQAYRVMVAASPPEQPAAYPSAEADEAHADLLRRLAAVPGKEK